MSEVRGVSSLVEFRDPESDVLKSGSPMSVKHQRGHSRSIFLNSQRRDNIISAARWTIYASVRPNATGTPLRLPGRGV